MGVTVVAVVVIVVVVVVVVVAELVVIAAALDDATVAVAASCRHQNLYSEPVNNKKSQAQLNCIPAAAFSVAFATAQHEIKQRASNEQNQQRTWRLMRRRIVKQLRERIATLATNKHRKVKRAQHRR